MNTIRQIEDIIGQLRETFHCPICLDLMKNAVSTKCDHKFCRHCMILTLGKRQSAPCPMCKEPFTKRSLQSLPQWNTLVSQVGVLIAAFERDTGVQFSPKKSALPLSPLCSQQSNSDLSQGAVKPLPQCEIYVEDTFTTEAPPKVLCTNINVRSGFPRKGKKAPQKRTVKLDNNDTTELLEAIAEAPLPIFSTGSDEQIVPSTRNKSATCSLAAYLENATDSQLGGNQNFKPVLSGANNSPSTKMKSSESAASFNVPNIRESKNAFIEARTPENESLLPNLVKNECGPAATMKGNRWFKEHCITPKSTAGASNSFHEVRAEVHVPVDQGENEALPEAAGKRAGLLDMDSVFTRETMTQPENADDKENLIGQATNEEDFDSNLDSREICEISDGGFEESGPLLRRETRMTSKLASTISSNSSQRSDDVIEIIDKKELEETVKPHSKLSYLRSPDRQKSSPGSDDPYSFIPSQQISDHKGRKANFRKNRQKPSSASDKQSKKAVVNIVKKKVQYTDENKRTSTPSPDKQSNVGIKTLYTYGKEPEIVLFDALKEHNSDPFSSPNDISNNPEPADEKVKKVQTKGRTKPKTKRILARPKESERKSKVEQLAEEISQAEDHDFVFSQQIREEAEQYRKMFKKNTRDNPRSNRVSFDDKTEIVQYEFKEADLSEVQNVQNIVLEDGESVVIPASDVELVKEYKEQSVLLRSRSSVPPTLSQLRRSDPVLQLSHKTKIPRRQTRSSDSIVDWEKLDEMNRDLRPKVSRKRPVAQITPSIIGKNRKRKKTAAESSDVENEEIEITEVNTADSGSETESLESDEEPVEYEEPDLEIQPPSVKKHLSQSSLLEGSEADSDIKNCIPETCESVDSNVIDLVKDNSKDDDGSISQKLENTSVGQSLGFVPQLSQTQPTEMTSQDDIIDVVTNDEPVVTQEGGSVGELNGEKNNMEVIENLITEEKPPKLMKENTDLFSEQVVKNSSVFLQAEEENTDISESPREEREVPSVQEQRSNFEGPTVSKVEKSKYFSPAGKLVKRSRNDSDSSEDDVLCDTAEAKYSQPALKKTKSRKISSSSYNSDAEIKPSMKHKRRLKTGCRHKTGMKRDDDSDSSDEEEESKSRRKSGIRAVRGLAALSMAYDKMHSPDAAKFASHRTPKPASGLTLKVSENTIQDDCEITMVEGTPQVLHPKRFGKLLSFTTDGKTKSEQESAKIESQSQDMIYDTPDDRTLKRISPRKQDSVTHAQAESLDDRGDYISPTPPKPDKRPSNAFLQPRSLSDEPTHVTPNVGSTQASSSEQNSESLIQPNVTKAVTQKIEQEFQIESDTAPNVLVQNEELLVQDNAEKLDQEVKVKEELPWQIKYSPDGKQILRAIPTTLKDPVEVEDRDVTSELERKKVQDNISADLAMIASMKEKKTTPTKSNTDEAVTPIKESSLRRRKIFGRVKEEPLEPYDEDDPYDGDDSLPSLEPTDETVHADKTSLTVECIENELEEEEVYTKVSKIKRRTIISSDEEEAESDASVTSSRAHNVTSSSTSDVDTQMIEQRDDVEADILRMKEQLKLMQKQYDEVVKDSKSRTHPQENEAEQDGTSPAKLSAPKESNVIAIKNIDVVESVSQSNIETIDPTTELEDDTDFGKHVAPECNEQTELDNQPKDNHPPSSSELVVCESDPETFYTPTKQVSSQRSRLSLSNHKKRKRILSNSDSPPACTSTPKGTEQVTSRSQHSPITIKSLTPFKVGNENREDPGTASAKDNVQTTTPIRVETSQLKSVAESPSSSQATEKKRLLEEIGDTPEYISKRPRIQNDNEKENLKRLSYIDKVEISPAIGSLKSAIARSSLSPASFSSANTSLSFVASVELPKKPNWCLTVSGVKRTKDKKLIKAFCSNVGCPLVEKYSSKVTHIIVKPVESGKLKCEWTLKYFQGVTSGKWVVSAEWIFDCMREGVLLSEDKYEINGDTNNQEPTYAPLKARTATSQLMGHLEVCCVGQFVNLPRDELHDLLDALGARVVQEPSMFTYDEGLDQIILVDSTDAQFDRKKMIKEGKLRSAQVVEKNWILNCIGGYEVKDTETFQI